MVTTQTRLTPALWPALDRRSLLPPTSEVTASEVESPRLEAPLDEALQADARASLTPSQMVEKKLVALLRGNVLPVSHAQMLYTSMNRR